MGYRNIKLIALRYQCCLDNRTDTLFVILSDTKVLNLSIVLRYFGGVYPDKSGLYMTNNLS